MTTATDNLPLKLQTKIMEGVHRITVAAAAIARGPDGGNKIVAVWNSSTQESASREFAAYQTEYNRSGGDQSRAADAILALHMTEKATTS